MNRYIGILVAILVLESCVSSLPIDDDLGANQLGEDDSDYIDLSHLGPALIGEPDDNATGLAVAEYTPESGVNPEELGSYLEGDMLVVPGQSRNGLSLGSARWPNGIVPFEIRGNFNAREMAILENSIMEYHTRTCIRFKPRTSEKDYISIESGNSGCWSAVGRVGGKQEVNLQSPGCLSKRGTPMHELMHALGFLHEQNRHERDNFVAIRFENIDPKTAANFDKVSASKTVDFGVTYDYDSVMHYSGKAFSRNGQPTIIPLQGGNHNMGQRDGFSPKDIQKLNSMYNCNMNNVAASKPEAVAAPVAGGNNNGAANRPGGRPQGQGGNIFLNFLGGLANGLGLTDEEQAQADANSV